MTEYINIGGRLHSIATGNVVSGADEILYEPTNGTPKKQSEVNMETYEYVANINAALQELSPDQTEALALATDVNDLKDNVVRSDVQTLTDAQKAQALANVGINGIDSEPNAGSDNLVKSGGVVEHYGTYTDNPEYTYVMTDSEGKILFGIKTNGEPFFGVGCPKQIKQYIEEKIAELSLDELIAGIQAQIDTKVDKEEGKSLIDSDYASSQTVIDNLEYIQTTTDNEDKILEGITAEGVKQINLPIDTPSATFEPVKNLEWISVTTDNEDKILEGINTNGEKYIGKFHEKTKKLIEEIIPNSNLINIPLLDKNFVSPIPCIITGNKGEENAMYQFRLSLNDKWVCRFKFKITENLLNQRKNAIIASIGGAKIEASVVPLTQHKETGTYNGLSYEDNWTTWDGGIAFNNTEINSLVNCRNIGSQAFSVKYIGTGNNATISNDGNKIIITVDGTQEIYNFNDYENVGELFADMNQNSDLELQFVSLDQRSCSELASFEEVSLKNIVHTGVSGSSTITEQIDSSPLYLYYAVSEKWYQVEIFRVGNIIVAVCDGIVTRYNYSNEGILTLGGNCGVLFKDLVICCNGLLDVEVIDDKVISSVNPYILIFECHGMLDAPYYTATPATTDDGLNSLSPDTMEYYFSLLDSKGYYPVSVEDIASYYTSGTPLPKRCYTLIFDDERWNIALDNSFRQVFSRHDAHPALAIITGRNRTITHNGSEITKEQASLICKTVGFSLVSHTKDHRTAEKLLPSEYIAYLTEDIYNADVYGINGSILVYPGGHSNVYMHDVMEFLGFKLGIEVVRHRYTTNISHNRFMLSRINIGSRIDQNGNFIINDYLKYII